MDFRQSPERLQDDFTEQFLNNVLEALISGALTFKAARIPKPRTASSNPIAYALRLRRTRVPPAKARVPSPRRVEGSGVGIA